MKATAKVMEEGGKQTVYLPESIHLADTEVLVQQLGDAVLLVPRDKVWETFVNGINGFPDDVFPNGREPDEYNEFKIEFDVPTENNSDSDQKLENRAG